MRKDIYLLLLIITGPFSIAQNLTDYFKIAAENNPRLQSKYKRFESAMERITQSKALPDPNISFGYFISPVETRVGPQKNTFSLSQQFPWFGALKAEKKSATLEAESYYQDFLDAKNKLFYEVSAAYYPLFELDRWIYIEGKNIQILKSYKDVSQKNLENGKGILTDILRIDLMLEESLTQLTILEQKKKPLETNFNILLNRSENEIITFPKKIEAINIAPDSLKLLSINENPSIKAIDLKSQSYKAQQLVAAKKGLPKFSVGFTYTMVDSRSDVILSDNGKDILMPMISMSVPVFRAKYSSIKKEAKLMEESLTFEKEAKKNDLLNSYRMTVFEIQQQQQLIELYKKQVDISERSLKLLFTSYKTSGKNFEEVLRMQQQILNYKKKHISAQSKLKILSAKLDYITAKEKMI